MDTTKTIIKTKKVINTDLDKYGYNKNKNQK